MELRDLGDWIVTPWRLGNMEMAGQKIQTSEGLAKRVSGGMWNILHSNPM